MEKSIKKSLDLTVVKELPTELAARHQNGEEGFWIYATKEIVDSTGDIVRVDGINFGLYHNPPDSRLKILAQHIRALPDGTAPVVGVLSDFVKTTVPYKGKMVKALALYVTWLRDGEGKLLPLSQHYYDLMNAKPYAGIDSGSVGLLVEDFKAIEDTGGYDIEKSTIFEFSLVTVPANAGATAIKELEDKLGVKIETEEKTETKEIGFIRNDPDGSQWVALDDHVKIVLDTLEKSRSQPYDLKSISETMLEMRTYIVKSLNELVEAYKSLSERLDVMESAIVVLTDVAKGSTSAQPKEPTPEQAKELHEAVEILERLNKFLSK